MKEQVFCFETSNLYFILFETKSYCVIPELLDASDPPASASKVAGTTADTHIVCPVSSDRQTPVCQSNSVITNFAQTHASFVHAGI